MLHNSVKIIVQRTALLATFAVFSTTLSQADVFTSSRDTGNVFYLPTTNDLGRQDNVLQVMQFANNPGSPHATGVLGVWFTGSQWAIYTQNRTTIPTGASFFVLAARADANRFIHVTNEGNVAGGITYLDHPSCNGHPGATLQVIAEYSPTRGFSGYHAQNPGVFYDSARRRWAIFNQGYNSVTPGAAAMPLSLRFHVTADSPRIEAVSSVWDPEHFVHTTDRFNTVGNVTYLPALPRDSYFTFPKNIHYFVTARFSYDWLSIFYDANRIICGFACRPYPGNVPQLNRAVGVYFDIGRQQWAIYTFDGSPMPMSTSFSVSQYTSVPG